MGPGFLARALGGFVRRRGACQNLAGALQARLDFESEWDDDTDDDDTIVDIGDYADDADFSEIEDEEILESAEYGEDDDS